VSVNATLPVAAARRRRLAWISLTVGLAISAGVAAGLATKIVLAHGATPALALPELHGQATWAAGARPAPPISLEVVGGGPATLAGLKGGPVLVTFLDSTCRSLCPLVGAAIATADRSAPDAARAAVVVVSVNPAGDTPASVQAAIREWGLPAGTRWLSGSAAALARVWHDYGIAVAPGTSDIVHGAVVYLIDRHGDERAGYLAPVLPSFLALDLTRIAQEGP
jgi:protein SCO1/2